MDNSAPQISARKGMSSTRRYCGPPRRGRLHGSKSRVDPSTQRCHLRRQWAHLSVRLDPSQQLAGTKPRPQVVDSGTFFCPEESGDRQYAHVVMKRAATVFFVPIANVSDIGEYVECQRCGATYEPSVLALGTESDLRNTIFRGFQRLAAAVIAADGRATPDERAAVLDVLNEQWGIAYRAEDLERDLQTGPGDLVSALEAAGSFTNLDGREKMMRAALRFANVDGDVGDGDGDGEMELLIRAGRALGLPKAHIRGLMAEVFD
jgi:hypothetical protein